ncbi:MAG TPA: protein phosphatase 2C domain-containing protein [Caulobacterales bacterium]|nr:protein phosphatase 2C domain-containing protein [Caulobacterales bacterium]
MLTLVESISLAGDRAKQNDDACGLNRGCAWVIDGATDLHETPLTRWASDASWIAQFANTRFHSEAVGANEHALRDVVRRASSAAAHAFTDLAGGFPDEHWRLPLASLLMAAETDDGLVGLDLGDCRMFTLDDAGRAHAWGGPPDAADNETKLAAQAAVQAGSAPLLRHAPTLELLRRGRDRQNRPGGSWAFCLLPQCADEARAWRVPLTSPAHILLCTDGFSALVDRYAAYDAASLVSAARDKGLQELGRELRAIEQADAGGARHPRWKRSDDATALFLRFT